MPDEPLTSAVTVTLSPSTIGFGVAVTVIDDVRFLHPEAPTAWTKTSDRAGGTPLPPVYRAVMACEPTAREEVANVARPAEIDDVPSSAAPS